MSKVVVDAHQQNTSPFGPFLIETESQRQHTSISICFYLDADKTEHTILIPSNDLAQVPLASALLSVERSLSCSGAPLHVTFM